MEERVLSCHPSCLKRYEANDLPKYLMENSELEIGALDIQGDCQMIVLQSGDELWIFRFC